MDNLAVLNNTFFLRERTCAKKEKEKMSLNKKKHGANPWRGEGKRRGGALYKYPNKLGGEKEKNEKQYEKYTERNYSDFVCDGNDRVCLSSAS